MKNLFGVIAKLVLWILGLGFIGFVILRLFFMDMAEVGHNGMAPTLLVGDQIAIWRQKQFAPGDIAICKNPLLGNTHVIGRVVAKQGSRIKTDKHERLVIDKQVVPITWLGTRSFHNSLRNQTYVMRHGKMQLGAVGHDIFIPKARKFRIKPRTVKMGMYLLGDNRVRHGNDSRYFREVDPNSCLGKVVMRLRPSPAEIEGIERAWFDRL
jgi:signal peptidase I